MADVFLSYSQADDFYPKEWVKSFHESLQRITIVTAGKRKFQIWRDTNDRKGNDLDQDIKEALDGSTFLLVLISPLYFEDDSGWCKKERDYFVNDVVKDATLAKRRIIAACKSFDDKEDVIQLPDELRSQFRYKLYKVNDAGIPIPIQPHEPEWDNCLLAIAYSIKTELKRVEEKTSAKRNRQVFLASSKELYDEQLKLKAELDAAGIKVVTLLPNLTEPDKWKNEFEDAFSSCRMSIHMLGQHYETKPSIKCSIDQQQWTWATNLATASNTRVLTWLPKGLGQLHEKQQQFLESLRRNDDLPPEHDFLEKTFEEFVGSVKDYLNEV